NWMNGWACRLAVSGPVVFGEAFVSEPHHQSPAGTLDRCSALTSAQERATGFEPATSSLGKGQGRQVKKHRNHCNSGTLSHFIQGFQAGRSRAKTSEF